MPALHRVFAWWIGYAAVTFLITLLWGVPPRLTGGLSVLDAVGSTTASASAMLALTMIPAMLVLAAWAPIAERWPKIEEPGATLVASSAVLALVIAAGVGMLGVNPAFPWRTGTYVGDAAQAMAAQFAVTWLAVLAARIGLPANRAPRPA